MEKTRDEFRNYDLTDRESVREFYSLNHRYQTHEFVQQKKSEYLELGRKKLSVWDAMEFLDTVVDDSDPDIGLSQLQHALQTAEAIRADGHPDWFVLTGFIHDMGKVLCMFGEPQWAVVGDTFPVGCAFSEKIVYAEFFDANPDSRDSRYSTKYGVYSPNCGLENVNMSWGHDEYLYQVTKDHLPEPALYMIRYHSFYAQHRERAYEHLMSDHDHAMFEWVNKFNPYDLYSKSSAPANANELRPYYEGLISNTFPTRCGCDR